MILVACLARAVEEDFSPLGPDNGQLAIGLSHGRAGRSYEPTALSVISELEAIHPN